MQPLIQDARASGQESLSGWSMNSADSQSVNLIARDNRTLDRVRSQRTRWRKLAITFALLTAAGLGYLYGAWFQSFGTVLHLEDALDYNTFNAILPSLQESWNTAQAPAGLISVGFLVALIVALVKLHRIGACVAWGRWAKEQSSRVVSR